jgi:hypothetical protein
MGQSNKRGTGWEFVHVAVDDASRLAYTELLADERKESAVAFTTRAIDWFARHGVSVERIMSDNGSAYQSFAFRDLLAARGIRHKRTRPSTPRTNGKAERFIQTSLLERIYAHPFATAADRAAAMCPWIDTYNASRPHSAPGRKVADCATGDWWTLFRSPDFDRLVKHAIADSPTLEAAKAMLAEARESVTEAMGALYPQVNFNASIAPVKVSASTSGLTPSEAPFPPNFNLFQVGPTVSYALDIFGGTRRRTEQQSAMAEYQRDKFDAAYLTLGGNTASLPIQVAAVRAQVNAIGHNLSIDPRNLELVRIERDDQQLSVAKHALAVLVGRASGNWSPPDFDLSTLTLGSAAT